MSVVHTKRNMVAAYEILEGDTHVETWVHGSEGRYLLLVQPIANYQKAVAWATSMADQMAHHIEIMPISADEYQQRHGGRAQ